jgi:hypothetical protein
MSTTDITISSNEVTVKDAVTIFQGGVVVVRLDATYDLEGVPAEYHQSILAIISRCTQLGMPTWESMDLERQRMEKYHQRKDEYDALPWHKRLFAKRPWMSDSENDE